jgi:hypothetical protein
VTKLNAHESALLLAQLSIAELYGKADLRSQLASIRLSAAIDAMKGNVNMQDYEAKVLGRPATSAEASRG